MSKNDLHIEVLGTKLTISADEDPEYLNALLEKYRAAIENVQRTTKITDPLKAAVLTGFLLCDDLEKAAARHGSGRPARNSDEASGEAEKITLGMISRLDEIMPDNEPVAGLPAANVPADLSPPAVIDAPADVPRAAPSQAAVHAMPREPQMAAAVPHTAAPRGADLPAAKAGVYKLQNTVKNYDWGSPEWLPAFLGQRNISRVPWAELWLGVHPSGASRVVIPGEAGCLLPELIARDTETFLGKKTSAAFGKLPFLLKVIAAAKPLSIQAHPNLARAKEGFERENAEGIPPGAPDRNYKDPNHKPEIICALSPFAALCGFRSAGEIHALFEILSLCEQSDEREHEQNGMALKAGFDPLLSALAREDENPLKAFITALYGLERGFFADLGVFVKSRLELLKKEFPEYGDEWNLSAYLAGLYPGDPGIAAPFFLNIIDLEPGEAMYLPPGVFHAYIRGMGIELMADSDNVLRGGLTAKRVDTGELSRALDFSEYTPEIMKMPTPLPIWYTYPAPAGEFSLSVMHGSENDIPYPETGPSILLVTEGKASLTGSALAETACYSGGELTLEKGESVFIPAGKNTSAVFSGNFTAYIASV